MTNKQILKYVTNFRKGVLGKMPSNYMCFAVCSPLHSMLSLMDISCQLIQGEVETEKFTYGHYWIELSDGMIIDPTADQLEGLNLPPVYMGELPKQYTAKTLEN